ncbi:MAG: hypothetical protein HYT38_02720 [Candidatus Sungbacteria bacterium]|uniref:Resolvase HTH domain-containing protein n=1 Tax=Candidatus Sungiibacteriota bacterium TaxID=2750080 RepID=A0A9D6DRK1_9BACT|nr:hypothetical protein [Candidatus Sungbacteria bacterium]
MRVHSENKIKKLKTLRETGYSINEIVKELSIPKTTVWHHIQRVNVQPKYRDLLKSKRGGSKMRTQKNWDAAGTIANNLLKSDFREKAVILAMLHWCEGHKKTCEFINSDGKMLKIYLTIIRKMLNIPEDRLKPTLRIFSGMNKKKCLEYWSHIIDIPIKKFKIRNNDGGTRGRTPYGMCRITVMKGANTLKIIRSLIDKIYDEFNQK